MQVVDVLVFTVNESGQWLTDDIRSVHTQQCRGRKIGFQDDSVPTEGDISHWSQVIESEIFFAGGFKFLLRAAKFIILHLQFNLMHL